MCKSLKILCLSQKSSLARHLPTLSQQASANSLSRDRRERPIKNLTCKVSLARGLSVHDGVGEVLVWLSVRRLASARAQPAYVAAD